MREAGRSGIAAAGLAQRPRQVAADGAKPAVAGPFHRVEQRLPAERAEAVLISVIDHPPVSRRPLHQRRVTARPPRLGGAPRPDDRVVRAILPRTVDRPGSRNDDHMPGRWSRRPPDRGDEVEIAVVAKQFRALGRERLDHPVVRIFPRLVSGFDGARGGKAVAGQPHAADAVDEQIPLSVLADDVAGIDAVMNVEVDRLAPRTFDAVRPNCVNRPAASARVRRDVNEIAAVMLGEIHGPDRSQVLVQRRADGAPVHQVAAVPDDQPRIGEEGREGHVIVLPVLEDGRIRVIAGHDRVKIGAVPAVGPPLTFKAPAPPPAGRRTRR